LSWISTEPKSKKKKNDFLEISSSNNFEEIESQCNKLVTVNFISMLLQQLNERFSNKKELITSLQYVIPKFCVNKKYKDIKPYVDFYIDNSNLLAIEAEFSLWQTKWTKILEKDRPSNVFNALSQCNLDFFSVNFLFIKYVGNFASLPVSTSTHERTFSTLKRLKTFLRNRTGQERLAGLALVCVHKDIEIDTEEVIKRFLNTSRKIKLIKLYCSTFYTIFLFF